MSQDLTEQANSSSNTPEFDAMWIRWKFRRGEGDIESPGEFGRRMERERDQLRTEVEQLKSQLTAAREALRVAEINCEAIRQVNASSDVGSVIALVRKSMITDLVSQALAAIQAVKEGK